MDTTDDLPFAQKVKLMSDNQREQEVQALFRKIEAEAMAGHHSMKVSVVDYRRKGSLSYVLNRLEQEHFEIKKVHLGNDSAILSSGKIDWSKVNINRVDEDHILVNWDHMDISKFLASPFGKTK